MPSSHIPYSCRALDQKSRIVITKAAVLKAESLQTSVFLTCVLDCAKPGGPVSYFPRTFCSPCMSGLSLLPLVDVIIEDITRARTG